MHHGRGIFIAFYGINNIGKTFHAQLLVERLKREGYKAVFIKYPVYSVEPTGSLLNRVLRSGKHQKISEDELQLWFTLNRYQFQPKLSKFLKAGYVVVAEDYVGTGIAWGTAKGANRQFLESMNKFLVQEDVAILLEGKRKSIAVEKKHLHETNAKFIQKCKRVLRILGKERKWKTILVQPNREKTAQSIWNFVRKRLP